MEQPETLDNFLLEPSILNVPPYQRQYSWGVEELEDFWSDLIYLQSGKRYYFGTFLLKKTNEKVTVGLRTYNLYDIIDGQQRIATSLIFLRCLFDELKSIKDSELLNKDVESLEKSYLLYGDKPKLKLLGDDQDIFGSLLLGEETPEARTASQKKLKNAQDFFRKKFRGAGYQKNEVKEFLLQLKDKLLNFEIVRHIVEDETEAALMFETINDRGKPLDPLDKTKSLMMYIVYLAEKGQPRELLARINGNFERIFRSIDEMELRVRGLGETTPEDEAQRIHLVLHELRPLTHYEDLTKTFLKPRLMELYRSTNKSSAVDYAVNYSAGLEFVYSALNEILNYDQRDETTNYLDAILGLRYEFIFPLTICCWMKSNKDSDELQDALHSIEVFLVRYSVLRSRRLARARSQIYDYINKLSHDLYLGRLSLKDVETSISNLTKNRASDPIFEAELKSPTFLDVTGRIATKLILYEYERELRKKQGREEMKIALRDWLSNNYEVDHIWPRESIYYELRGQTFFPSTTQYEEYQRCGERLGNLVVLPAKINASLGNTTFERKKDEYSKIPFLTANELTRYSEWREKQIEERTSHIVIFAMKRFAVRTA